MKKHSLSKKLLTSSLAVFFFFGVGIVSSFAQNRSGEVFFEVETIPVIRQSDIPVKLYMASANLTGTGGEIILREIIVTDQSGKKIKEAVINRKLKDLSDVITDSEVLRENLGLNKRESERRNKILKLTPEQTEEGLYLENIGLDIKANSLGLDNNGETTVTVTGLFVQGDSEMTVTRVLPLSVSVRLPRPFDPQGKGYWVAGDAHMHTKYSHELIVPPWLGVDDRARDAAYAGMGWINITDHAPNMSPDGQEWTVLRTDCGLATVDTGVVTLPGLELSTADVDEGYYSTDDEYKSPYDSHYLAYGINTFINQPPTKANRYYENWTGQKVIDETINNNPDISFGAIAHPFNANYPWFPWWSSASGYSALELVNGAENHYIARSATLQQWDALLRSGLSNTIKTGEFVAGSSNSDAHYGLSSFGQTVSYALVPSSHGFSASELNDARRRGRIVASTDGSLAFFDLNDGAIGDVVNVPRGNPIKIKITAYPVDGKRIGKAKLITSYGKEKVIHHFKTDRQTGERYATVTITPGKDSDLPYPPLESFFRLEVQFVKRGECWTTYTNPIFVKLFSLPPLESDFPQGKGWQWTMNPIGWGVAVTSRTSAWEQVQPGDHIKSYIWFKKELERGYINLQFHAYDATGTSLGAFCGTTIYPWATGWVHMETEGYAPPNAANIRAEIVVADYPNNPIWIDAFRVINYRSGQYCRYQFEGQGDNPFIFDYPAPLEARYVDVFYP